MSCFLHSACFPFHCVALFSEVHVTLSSSHGRFSDLFLVCSARVSKWNVGQTCAPPPRVCLTSRGLHLKRAFWCSSSDSLPLAVIHPPRQTTSRANPRGPTFGLTSRATCPVSQKTACFSDLFLLVPQSCQRRTRHLCAKTIVCRSPFCSRCTVEVRQTPLCITSLPSSTLMHPSAFDMMNVLSLSFSCAAICCRVELSFLGPF